jgi:para-aminobenzoate synthetase / 4-amino-4-deoxychorismate lyase
VGWPDPQIDFAPAPEADVALGVFETLLVVDGRPLEAGRHLERLRASTRVLYGAELATDLEARVAGAAAGHGLARLRIDVAPPATTPKIELRPFDPALVLAPGDVAVVTVRVRGGAGPHKLIDRGWLARIEAAAGAGARSLLVTRSGALLETTRANVFLLRHGELATPPLDGSILPGVMREVVLEQARRLGIATHETPLTLEDLRAADMVLLSGSLRRLERARVRPDRRSDAAAERLAGALDVRGGGAR